MAALVGLLVLAGRATWRRTTFSEHDNALTMPESGSTGSVCPNRLSNQELGIKMVPGREQIGTRDRAELLSIRLVDYQMDTRLP
jgi:hypothetical protein